MKRRMFPILSLVCLVLIAVMLVSYFAGFPRVCAFAATGLIAIAWSAFRNATSTDLTPLTLSKATPPGFCANCGYDLRATPDRCPECGTIPQKKPQNSN